MRIKNMLAGLVAVIGLGLLMPGPAQAFGWKHYDRHSATDPYSYRYEHRGYYPYYGSRYWRPARKVRNRRFRYTHPRYHAAWGHYRKHIHKNHHSHPHGTVAPHGHRHHHW
jgi:hypothetical protein